MLTCVLNAAEGWIDIILGKGNDILCIQSWHAPTKGTELLAPVLGDTLRRLGACPTDIARFACVCGPGSFTGIRLVLSTVAAMRRITCVPCAGLDYMHALALTGQDMASQPMGYGGQIWVLTHARRDLVHFQGFVRASHISHMSQSENTPALPQPISPVVVCSPANATEHMLSLSQEYAVMLGSGLARNTEVLKPTIGRVRALCCERPSATALWTLAQHAVYAHKDIEPLYIRPCDAVDNLSHIAEKQGMLPEKAHARLQELLQKDCL